MRTVLGVVLFLFVVVGAFAQQTSLNGTVTDPTGAVIPNASLLLSQAETSNTREAKSDSAGRYTFAQVAPVPPLLDFQGRLAKPDGTAVADGTYSIRFSLWDSLSGGNDNLLTVSRSGIAMRVWHQTWNLGAPFSAYKDVAFRQDGVGQFPNDANYLSGTGGFNSIPRYTGLTTLGPSGIFDDGRQVSIDEALVVSDEHAL